MLNLIRSSPLTEAMTFAFSSVFILLLCYKVYWEDTSDFIPVYRYVGVVVIYIYQN